MPPEVFRLEPFQFLRLLSFLLCQPQRKCLPSLPKRQGEARRLYHSMLELHLQGAEYDFGCEFACLETSGEHHLRWRLKGLHKQI